MTATGWTPLRSPGAAVFFTGTSQGRLRDDIEWIETAAGIARSGYVQGALLGTTFLWALASLLRQGTHSIGPDIKPFRIRCKYELCSQIFRAAAATFILVAASQAGGYWLDVALVGCSFVLGLLGLVGSVRRCHAVFLQHVNLFLLFGSLLVLMAAELLPNIQVGSNHEINRVVLGAVVSLGAALLVGLLTPRDWIPPPMDLDLYRRAPEPKPSAEETCSWIDYFLTYGWLTPLVWKGCRKPLAMDDLPALPWYDEPLLLLSRVQAVRKEKGGTLRTVLVFQRKEILAMAGWAAASFAVELVAPFAIYQLLSYLSDPQAAALHPGVWLFLMFAGPICRSVTFQQYVFMSTRLIVRIKSAMTQELYHRAMSSMELEEDVLNKIVAKGGKKKKKQQQQQQPPSKSTSAGRLANLMASDIDAICRGRDIVILCVGVPIGITISFIGLYRIMGWTALVGTAIMILAAPVPVKLGQMMGKSQRVVKAAQDSRISLVSEYLGSIKAIKYFAWEEPMMKTILAARGREQKGLWRITVLWILLGQTAELIPFVTLLIIFGLYVGVLKQRLTAPVAFTALTLIMTMRRNIAMFSVTSNGVVNAIISIERLDRYFANTTPLVRHPPGPLRIDKATFRRSKKASFVLRDVSIDFVEGGLNAVTGASGSGKTTLLLAILGEAVLENGLVTRPEDVAFASQTPWLQSDTVRGNILFHAPFESTRYDAVIAACCLAPDLAELPAGDQTEVGENGTALSGGQRARVALARALYSRAPLLLLDDVFSALDAKTSASVWQLCFCSDMLQGRTVVLVTQMPWVAAQSDLAVTMADGVVVAAVRNLDVVRKPISPEEEQHQQQETYEAAEGVEEPAFNGDMNDNGSSILSCPAPATKSPADEQARKDEIASEMHASGGTGTARLMFFKYMLYFGGPLYAVFALAMTVLVNAALIGTSYWLSVWVNAYGTDEAVDIAFYLGIYAALTLGSVVLGGCVTVIYANGAWHAARRLHDSFLRAVMGVSLAWWKTVPVGRVVNRFSRDLGSVDDMLFKMLQVFLEDVAKIVFRVAAVSSILPVFMLPGLLICCAGAACGEMYTRTAVTVKRLVSSSQSPLFSQFADSMAGLTVIRARHGMPLVFGDRLAERLRAFSRATEANFNCNRWVALRIDCVTALVGLAAGLIAIAHAGTLAAGLVGFSLTNATGLSETILQLVRAMNNLEVELQSFYRVQEYAQIEPEEKTEMACADDGHDGYDEDCECAPPEGWPRTGAVEFCNVTIRYDPDGPDILKDINLRFAAGQRVAIVGRTGSGKSTLLLSLLRFTHIVSGRILYDGIDITTVPRKRLRQALTLIPQEAVLFNGTVGSNLDPSGEIPARRLERVLAACADIPAFRFQDRELVDGDDDGDLDEVVDAELSERTPLLAEHGNSNGNGHGNGNGNGNGHGLSSGTHDHDHVLALTTPVLAKGENFSHGQRQVLSLCRALVRRSRLMLLDEATASMDYATDRGIQAVLRRELRVPDDDSDDGGGDGLRTLVTVAHRLRTIVDYDVIVVMGAGRVLEVGMPAELYRRGSDFFDMVRHSGEGEDLARLMGGSDAI